MAQGKGVYKRGNVWWLAYADANGQLVRESSGTDDYKAALKKLAHRRADVAKGKQINKPKIRNVLFTEAVEKYLEWAKPQRAYENKYYMARKLVAKFGNIPLRRFNVSLLEADQQMLLGEGKAPATINRRMALIKHLFSKASDWSLVDDDTLRTVRKVKMLKEPPGRLRYLTPEEANRLIRECKNPALQAIVTLAVNTGMRRGEILGLKWDNVDLRNGYLLVEDSKNGDRREVPINGAVRDVLSKIIRRINSTYVFSDERGMVFKGGRNAFVRACRRAGIYNFRFHDLRHAAASFMAMGGVDLLSIGKILGHRTAGMTRRYAHLSPGYLRNAVDVIDQALNAPAEPTSQSTSQSVKNSYPADPSSGVTARN